MKKTQHYNHNNHQHNYASHGAHHQQFHTQIIDIEGLYRQLSAALNERAQEEIRQDNLWHLIKQTHSDHRSEMHEIDVRIGNNTHKLNRVISQLCHYKKTHRAMNLADTYLQKEIARNQHIVSSWNRAIDDVERGRRTLIDASGYEHTDTTSARQYVKQKMEQIRRLEQWQNYVHSHRA